MSAEVKVLKAYSPSDERQYTPQELVHELQDLVNNGVDRFVLIAFDEDYRYERFASSDGKMRVSEILMMMEQWRLSYLNRDHVE